MGAEHTRFAGPGDDRALQRSAARLSSVVATEAEKNTGRTSNSVSSSRDGADHNTEHLWLDMQAGRAYELRGMCCADQGDFTRDFALARQLREAPGTEPVLRQRRFSLSACSALTMSYVKPLPEERF
jgi:hypothetical protein